mmetsp:Transcript_30252/g.66957  ORF Transcript_30252/g.66957 Transcript_30252/m.66957 type:complete len:220 (+) Transcript_30252:738-1397(+)
MRLVATSLWWATSSFLASFLFSSCVMMRTSLSIIFMRFTSAWSSCAFISASVFLRDSSTLCLRSSSFMRASFLISCSICSLLFCSLSATAASLRAMSLFFSASSCSRRFNSKTRCCFLFSPATRSSATFLSWIFLFFSSSSSDLLIFCCSVASVCSLSTIFDISFSCLLRSASMRFSSCSSKLFELSISACLVCNARVFGEGGRSPALPVVCIHFFSMY